MSYVAKDKEFEGAAAQATAHKVSFFLCGHLAARKLRAHTRRPFRRSASRLRAVT